MGRLYRHACIADAVCLLLVSVCCTNAEAHRCFPSKLLEDVAGLCSLGGPLDPSSSVIVQWMDSPSTPFYFYDVFEHVNRVHPESFEATVARQAVEWDDMFAEELKAHRRSSGLGTGCMVIPYQPRPHYHGQIGAGLFYSDQYRHRMPNEALKRKLEELNRDDTPDEDPEFYNGTRFEGNVLSSLGLDLMGTIDFMEAMGQLSEAVTIRGRKNREIGWDIDLWLGGFQQLYQLLVMGSTVLRAEDYGNDVLAPLQPQRYLLELQEKQGDGDTTRNVHSGDLKAWQELYDGMRGSFWVHCREHRNTPCACRLVGCEVQGAVQRLVVIALDHVEARGQIPDSIGQLQSLRMFHMKSGVTAKLPPSFFTLVLLESIAIHVVEMPPSWGAIAGAGRLQSLMLAIDMNVPLVSDSDMWPFLDNLTDVREARTRGNFKVVRVHPAAPRGMQSHARFDAVCSLRSLVLLDVQGTSSPLPSCLGQLTRLVRIRFTGNQAGSSLPPELGQLTNLRSFLAFHNGERGCPDTQEMYDATLKVLQPTGPGKWAPCRLKSTYFAELNDQPFPLVCQPGALQGTIPDTLRGWKNINLVWMDANWISGTIPEWIGEWTALRRLDLHDNHLSGTIPASFAKLTQLQKVQLQHNFLSGSLPSALGRLNPMPQLVHFNVGLNPNMTGCLPRHWPKGASVVLAGTQIRGKCP